MLSVIPAGMTTDRRSANFFSARCQGALQFPDDKAPRSPELDPPWGHPVGRPVDQAADCAGCADPFCNQLLIQSVLDGDDDRGIGQVRDDLLERDRRGLRLHGKEHEPERAMDVGRGCRLHRHVPVAPGVLHREAVPIQCGDVRLVDVHEQDVMSGAGECAAGDSADGSGTPNGDVHDGGVLS